jgi:hypothetical protein
LHLSAPGLHPGQSVNVSTVGTDGAAEGWYLDPFGQHEARWFSDGDPTALVRDGSVEARDAPPDHPVAGPLERWHSGDGRANDLRRADDVETGQPDYGDAGERAITAYFPPGVP